MLAERRKKVIYSNNPRGTHWANDSQKFGQKMLKSMGWEEGKGLGKNGDGITENIKASFKFDNNGFGFKRKLNDFIEENNVYEQILSDLAQHHANPQIAKKKTTAGSDAKQAPKLKSIFKHHHRSKFIRAKNQSMQSEKDLFCIFPTSKTSSETKEQSSNTESSSSETESKNEQTSEVKSTMPHMTTVESKVSIDDYFKQKMINRRLKQQNCTDNNEKTAADPENPAVEDTFFETKLYRDKKQKKKQKHNRPL